MKSQIENSAEEGMGREEAKGRIEFAGKEGTGREGRRGD